MYGLEGWRPFLINGNVAVGFFFVMAFYFTISKISKDIDIPSFLIRRYFRLAPTILFATLTGYVLIKFGLLDLKYNLSADIENVFLIRDLFSRYRWGALIHPAWYCCDYLFLVIFYVLAYKTFNSEGMSLLMFLAIFVGWRLYDPQLNVATVFIHYDFGRALFCLGCAHFLHKALLYSRNSQINCFKGGVLC